MVTWEYVNREIFSRLVIQLMCLDWIDNNWKIEEKVFEKKLIRYLHWKILIACHKKRSEYIVSPSAWISFSFTEARWRIEESSWPGNKAGGWGNPPHPGTVLRLHLPELKPAKEEPNSASKIRSVVVTFIAFSWAYSFQHMDPYVFFPLKTPAHPLYCLFSAGPISRHAPLFVAATRRQGDSRVYVTRSQQRGAFAVGRCRSHVHTHSSSPCLPWLCLSWQALTISCQDLWQYSDMS